MSRARTPDRRPRRPEPRHPHVGRLAVAVVLLLVAGVGAGACASTGPPQEVVHLVVENRRSETVTIYAVRHSSRFRLGTVAGVATEQFTIRSHMLGPGGELRLAIDPLGDINRRFTRSIHVSGGDTVVLELIF